VFSADILVHVKVMHPSRLLLLLLLAACIGTGVTAHTFSCKGLNCQMQCLLGLKEPGWINADDLQRVLGVNLPACEGSTALENVKNFTEQRLCGALGHQALDGFALGAKQVSVPDLNQNFKCSDASLHFHANTMEDIIKFVNEKLKVPECTHVQSVDICGFECKQNVGWANLQLQVCTDNKRDIYVYKPYTTLYGVGVDLTENPHLQEMTDLLGSIRNNSIIMVPEKLRSGVVEVFRWRHAKNAVSKEADLSKLREIWRDLCLHDNSQRDVFRCDDIKNEMLAMCEKYRSDEHKLWVGNLTACVKEAHDGNTVLHEQIMQNVSLTLCNLMEENWTIPEGLLQCVKRKGVTPSDEPGKLMDHIMAFMTSIKEFFQLCYNGICIVSPLFFLLQSGSYVIISMIRDYRKETMIALGSVFMTLTINSSDRKKSTPGVFSFIWSVFKSLLFLLVGPVGYLFYSFEDSEIDTDEKESENTKQMEEQVRSEMERIRGAKQQYPLRFKIDRRFDEIERTIRADRVQNRALHAYNHEQLRDVHTRLCDWRTLLAYSENHERLNARDDDTSGVLEQLRRENVPRL